MKLEITKLFNPQDQNKFNHKINNKNFNQPKENNLNHQINNFFNQPKKKKLNHQINNFFNTPEASKIFCLLMIYLACFGSISFLVINLKKEQVEGWLNSQSDYFTTPMNSEIAEKAIKINLSYRNKIFDEIDQLKNSLTNYSTLEAFIKEIYDDLSKIIEKEKDYFEVNQNDCKPVLENLLSNPPTTITPGSTEEKCQSLERAKAIINGNIGKIEINNKTVTEIKSEFNAFSEDIRNIQKSDRQQEISKELENIKTKIDDFKPPELLQSLNSSTNSSLIKLLELLDKAYGKETHMSYEKSLIESFCKSEEYRSFCSDKKQNSKEQDSQDNRYGNTTSYSNSNIPETTEHQFLVFLKFSIWNSNNSKLKKKFEQELKYIVMLSGLDASPAQKERITQQLNFVKQQVEIVKNKLIFYYSLDVSTGILAWPLALISGVLFVFLTKDGLENVFKSINNNAKIPVTLFIVNTFCLILVIQVPLLLQVNRGYEYHLKSLKEGVEIEQIILSYIATNGESQEFQEKEINILTKNSRFIRFIDQSLLTLLSRFDPGVNSEALPDITRYTRYFSQPYLSDNKSNSTPPISGNDNSGNQQNNFSHGPG